MKHLYIFWLNVFVFGGQSVVDKTTVVEGQTFTITCDHLHVNGTMPNCLLDFLEVRRCLSESFDIILSFSDGHTEKIPIHWTGHCINPGNNLDIKLVQCKINVKEAMISDTGRYACAIGVTCGRGYAAYFESASDIVVTKANTKESEAPSNFDKETTIGLCLMMVAAIEL